MNFDVREYAHLVYEFDVNDGMPSYTIDNSSHIPPGMFHRIAYYVQLQHPRYGNQWVYTAFDAFTSDVRKIGIPRPHGPEWVFKQSVHNLVVKSSSSALVNRCSAQGSIVFSAYNFGDPSSVFDCVGDYGTMQVSSNDTTIWAYSHIGHATCDIGIGPNVFSDKSPQDWTFSENGKEYSIKHIKVYILYNQIGHQNEVLSADTMRLNLRGIAHGDTLRYDVTTRTWGATQIPYAINAHSQDLPNFIIALSGQSNSQGWNSASNSTDWRDQPHERIFGYNPQAMAWEVADLNSQSLGASWHRMPGWQCFAFHMAHRLVEAYPDIRPGIVNVGIGGQAICRWAKYSQHEQWHVLNCERALSVGVHQGDIFDLHAGQLEHALSLCNGGCKVDVLCWHQGESDCDKLGGNADYYKASLQRVIAQYRSLRWCSAATPFIVGETTSNERNVQLHEIAATDGNMRCVSTTDLPRQREDPIHFDSRAQRTLGTRYFRALRSLYDT